jgi:hypothetical protein
MSFAAITLCFVSQLVFIVVYFVIDSVRKLLDTPSCTSGELTFVTFCLLVFAYSNSPKRSGSLL